jgi:GNAT superfamily N-acetyltransferase
VQSRFIPAATARHRSHLIVGNAPGARIVRSKDGRRVILRAASRGDGPAAQSFVRGLSLRSRHNRFFSPVQELTPDQFECVTRPPGAHGLALVAEAIDGESRIVALSQYVVFGPADAEFAVVVDDAWQRQGLGDQMIGLLAEHAARAGLASFVGFVLSNNGPMLALLSKLACEFANDDDPNVVRAVKRFDIHEGARASRSDRLVDAGPRSPAAPPEAAQAYLERISC